LLHKITEDNPEDDYFDLLQQGFAGLDGDSNVDVIRLWFLAQLLRLSGSSPDLATDTDGQPLTAAMTYNFDFDSMAFTPHTAGHFTAGHIKVLRLLFNITELAMLRQVQGMSELLPDIAPLLHAMRQTHLRV